MRPKFALRSMRVQITDKIIAEARRAQATCKVFDITDARARGLVLRVKAKSMRWGWRGERANRTHRLDLGDVTDLTTEEARRVAEAATGYPKKGWGGPDVSWLEIEREKIGKGLRCCLRAPRSILSALPSRVT
jgi:hypothetical protein